MEVYRRILRETKDISSFKKLGDMILFIIRYYRFLILFLYSVDKSLVLEMDRMMSQDIPLLLSKVCVCNQL